jgi:polysaccharide export outer membrane protein
MFCARKSETAMLGGMFLVLALGGFGVVEAAEPLKKGDQVVAIRQAPIVRGQQTLMTVEAGTVLTVTEAKGDWLGVQAERGGKTVSGWIRTTAVKAQGNGQEKTGTTAGKPSQQQTIHVFPAYRIAPPDVIQIEMQKMVPLPPYRIGIYDVLQIRASGTLVDQPIDGFYLVQAEGTVDLGPAYGKVRVAGMTIEECNSVIQKKLLEILKQPEVSVQLSRTAGTQLVTGEYLVGPDGTINLRQYGTVLIAGKTLAEARQAVEQHLAKFFATPEVSLDVLGYNSKVYYVITEGPTLGFKVTRLPFTGNETVLDALSRLQILPHFLGFKIWIARPASAGSAKETVLPVDWEAITRQGSSATNYQLLPGDRLLIVEESPPPEPPAEPVLP